MKHFIPVIAISLSSLVSCTNGSQPGDVQLIVEELAQISYSENWLSAEMYMVDDQLYLLSELDTDIPEVRGQKLQLTSILSNEEKLVFNKDRKNLILDSLHLKLFLTNELKGIALDGNKGGYYFKQKYQISLGDDLSLNSTIQAKSHSAELLLASEEKTHAQITLPIAPNYSLALADINGDSKNEVFLISLLTNGYRQLKIIQVSND